MVERGELGRSREKLLSRFSVAAVYDRRCLDFGGRRPPLQAWRT
jgi:hypothetical protein